MTVKELIEKLKTVDQNRLVILSSDSEGNHYSPLAGGDTTAYTALCTWAGEIGLEELTSEAIESGFTQEDVAEEDSVPALVLYPIN